MDDNRNGKNQHNGQSATSSSLTRYEQDSTARPSDSYLASMAQIVSKSVSLANAPSLTREELLIRSRDWAEELFQVVPENQLSQSLKRAFADHETAFPLSAYELKTGYKRLMAANAERAAEEAQQSRQISRADAYSKEAGEPNCIRCRDTNVEMIYSQKGKFLGARPGCNHLPVYPDEPIYKEHQRHYEMGEMMMRTAREAGRELTPEEVIALVGGEIGKPMPKANVARFQIACEKKFSN